MNSPHQEWQLSLEDTRYIVFRAVHNMLRRRGFLVSQAAELADDATQYAFLRLIETKSAKDFHALAALVTWLRTTAINKVWEDQRRSKMIFTNLADCFVECGSQNSFADQTDVKQAMVRKSLEEDLSVEDREILLLKYDSGKTDHEIAAQVIPPDNRTASARSQDLRRRRQDALARLRCHLERRGLRGLLLDSECD